MKNYLDSLNPSQRAAVEYCDGPQLVIAGAGSGKTRVLTMKIAYLLEHGYQPDNIIALTFTKKAATEMQTRIEQLVGHGAGRRLWMGTFHSLFSRILRHESARIGFKSDFTIYDQSDSKSLIKAIIKEMGLDDKTYKPNTVQCQISNAKNNLVTPAMYMANPELQRYDAMARRPRIGDIYQMYWNRCYQAGAMDFDDLLLYTNILFRDHPDCLQQYQEYFRYILVDEYQDTNRAQHLIVEQLSRLHRHLCVVGDDAQSIYSFRGAEIRNILDMSNKIPGTKLFKLEQNYRSTQNIVEAANSLIAHNREQIKKTIFSDNDRGSLIKLTGSYSDLEEAGKVANQIYSLHEDDDFSYRECAILYRTNAQSRTLEEALRKRGIDYRIFGGLSFYQRKEIKDIISYLRLINNPADEEAFKRIINYPTRGIGDTTVQKLIEGMRVRIEAGQGGNLFDVCTDPVSYGVAVNKGTIAKLAAFVQMIQRFQELNLTENAFELTRKVIIETGINNDLAADTSVEGQSRRENVQELLNAIQTFVISCTEEGNPNCHLVDFLADVSLSGALEPAEQADPDADFVALMTIHQAKGLEFTNVFITGMEEGLLPSEMAMGETGGVEEERRLFYVALTRAEKNCFLSYAKSRFRNGKSESCSISRFVKDIDARYLDRSADISASTPNYGSMGGGSFGSHGGFGGYQPSPYIAPSYRPTSHSAEPASRPQSSFQNFEKVKRIPSVPKPSAGMPTATSLSFGGQQLNIGTRIIHDRFGEGSITQIQGTGADARISVHFDTMGDKTLLLKFAKFTVK